MESLPPNKRYRLITKSQSQLPAKKRKASSPEPQPPFSYSLPAKKRVLALPPLFDLNIVFEQQEEEESQIPIKLNNSDEISDEEDDGIVCAICRSTDGDPSDPIVLCDGCDLMVHTSCYGINSVPSGDWFCSLCSSSSNSGEVSCCLCPNSGGALKPTTAGHGGESWAHVVCAVLVPEVYFEDSASREGINFSKVPKWRWNRRCYLCDDKNGGCVVGCSEPKCGLAFHVTCGLDKELCFEYKKGKNKSDVVAAFCKTHSDLWEKQEASGKYKIVAREEKD